MRNRFLPLALLALAALAAGLWFAARGGGPAGAGERTAARPPAAAPLHGADGARPAELAGASGETDDTAPVQAAAPAARAVATTEYEDELKAGLWVEGRVAFPPDTPLDERVRVVAKGAKFEHGPAHSAEVGADGSFRVAFPAGSTSGRLDLEARYLYLDESLKVAPRNPGSVVLAARLGGVLSGKVLPPPDAAGGAQALVGGEVTLVGFRRTGDFSMNQAVRRQVELDASLSFAFTALAPDIQYDLSFDAQAYEPVDFDDLLVQGGAETVIDVQVLPGVDATGRVLDAAGAPAAGARVMARVEISGPGNAGQWRNAMTGSDGAFELRGISPGAIKLQVNVKGHEPLELDLGRLERGATRAGLELKLSRGSTLAGRVVLPDGTPAEGASVSAEPLDPDANNVFGSMGGIGSKTDASGAFTITGLEPGAHKLSARLLRKETVLEQSELLGKERPKTVRTTLRAALASVETGTADILLELSDGEGVSGVVLDDLGAPLDAFRVSVARVEQRGTYTHTSGRRGSSFKEAHGAFTLSGLEPGTFRLTVEAEGHMPSAPIDLEIPRASALAPIRLTRSARIAGLVLLPTGEPAARARIETTGETEESRTLGLYLADGDEDSFRFAVSADGKGRFDTDNAGLGTVKVRAALQGYSSSEVLELTLVPGVPGSPVTLHLGAGATLTGVVLDAAGKPMARRRVEIEWRSEWNRGGLGGFETSLATDEAGAFELAGLEPGSYSVVAPPTDAELAALGVSTSDGARDVLSGRADVEVPASGAHVVVRAPDARPIRLVGTITSGGEPLAAHIWVNQQEGEDVSGETDASGAYELLLPAPGEYWVSVHLNQWSTSVNLPLTVTGPGEQRFDVDIPLGSLSGRVLGPGGPLADIRVELQRHDGSGSGASAYATSDSDGRYTLEKLPAGTWTVGAGGDGHGFGHGSEPSPYTRAEVAGVAVASGQHVRDVDLHLGAAGTVSGRVLTAGGEPAQGALVHARASAGEVVQPLGSAQVDAQGNFSIGGLEPGSYALGAMHGLSECAEADIDVEVGKDSKVELRLAPATLVRVVVRDAAGAVTQAHVTCLRSDGADFSYWFNWFHHVTRQEGEHLIGPLPPGTYTVKADREGATPSTKTIALDGEPETLVELVL